MEFPSLQFLTGLAAVVVIDLVLAGDNAIVIALAARNVPQRLRRRAIVSGTAGAIAVRALLTGAVVWLLQIPGLLLAGGAALAWIGYKLLLPDKGAGDAASAPGTFWSAMRTIVVADTIMGMDNILAVAGAAHGSYLLVVLGLLISVPIMVWGSTLLLAWVERLPAIIYVGAGVVLWTSVKMMTSEPFVRPYLDPHPGLVALAYLTLVPAVLWAGFAANHRELESSIHARLAQRAGRSLSSAPRTAHRKEKPMLRVLLPLDGSENSDHAVRHILREFTRNTAMEVHLLNVQPRFSRHIARFTARRSRQAWHEEQAAKALAKARALLDAHGVPYAVHVSVGARAQSIVDAAVRLRCHHIVMATARKNSLTRMIEDSVTSRVLELTEVPVEVIAGNRASGWERWGIPAAVAAAIGALLVAAAD